MKILFKTETRNLYNEIKDKEFKPITFKLYNKIDDDLIPQTMSKRDKTVYGIDDFEFHSIDLSDKEKFLLSIHNKEFLKLIAKLKKKLENNDKCIVDVSFNDKEVNVIKIKGSDI